LLKAKEKGLDRLSLGPMKTKKRGRETVFVYDKRKVTFDAGKGKFAFGAVKRKFTLGRSAKEALGRSAKEAFDRRGKTVFVTDKDKVTLDK